MNWPPILAWIRNVHQFVNHAEEYVRATYTRRIENFWSLLKHGIKRTYVSVERFHLFRYLDEETSRFNARKNTDAQRFAPVLKIVAGRRVTYKQIIGAGSLDGIIS
jgi:ISXO2-like transposase domain